MVSRPAHLDPDTPVRVLRWACILAIGLLAGHIVKETFVWHDSVAALPAAALIWLAWRHGLGLPLGVRTRRPWALSLLPISIWVLYAYLQDYFGSASIDALLFHLRMGAEGHVDRGYMATGLLYLAGLAVLTAAILCLFNMDWRLRRADARIAAALFFLNPFFLTHPFWGSLPRAISNEPLPDLDLGMAYVEPSAPRIRAPRNLVLIYAESVERSFDKAAFGDAYAPMAALAARGIDFAGVQQIQNTGWTIAGMVASQCGVPLMPFGLLQGSEFDQVEQFLPGVRCLGDLLRERGYTGVYLGGADLDFAGKRQFLTQHGYARSLGLDELEHRVPADYRNSWGLHDDSVFDLALEQARALHGGARPYFLTILTLSAHFPVGYPARRCERWQGPFDGEDILYSVECTGRLIHDLVDALEREGLLDNSIVAVVSDHLSMKNSAWRQLNEGPRTNTFFALGSGIESRRIARPSSMLDVFPTLLDLLDGPAATTKAGLGVSLLRNEPTLVERFGVDGVDFLIEADQTLGASIWSGLEDDRIEPERQARAATGHR